MQFRSRFGSTWCCLIEVLKRHSRRRTEEGVPLGLLFAVRRRDARIEVFDRNFHFGLSDFAGQSPMPSYCLRCRWPSHQAASGIDLGSDFCREVAIGEAPHDVPAGHFSFRSIGFLNVKEIADHRLVVLPRIGDDNVWVCRIPACACNHRCLVLRLVLQLTQISGSRFKVGRASPFESRSMTMNRNRATIAPA